MAMLSLPTTWRLNEMTIDIIKIMTSPMVFYSSLYIDHVYFYPNSRSSVLRISLMGYKETRQDVA